MDFHDEQRAGAHNCGITAGTVAVKCGRAPAVRVRFTGSDADGVVVSEGDLTSTADEPADAGAFLGRTRAGLAALHGRRPRKAAGAAVHAGGPSSPEHGARLRSRCPEGAARTPANTVLAELAVRPGCCTGAVRAALPRVGCDPDVPGRELPNGP